MDKSNDGRFTTKRKIQLRKDFIKKELINNAIKEIYSKKDDTEANIVVKTEYLEKFGAQPITNEASDISEYTQMNEHKLYESGSNAISFWLTQSDSNRIFKQWHPLTKLNSECLDDQWR